MRCARGLAGRDVEEMEWRKGGGVDSEKEGEDAEGGMDVARGERAGRAAGLCVAQPVYHSTAKDGGHIVSN